jgi:myo-inositol-1(or 4)-monophosphatase
VAAGRLIGFFEPVIKSWDCLGAVAVVQAAGLKTNDFLAGDGLFSGNPIIAGNDAVYAELSVLAAYA